MKKIVYLVGLALLLTSVGCEVEEHGPRGAAFGPAGYGRGYRGDRDWNHDYDNRYYHRDWDDRD